MSSPPAPVANGTYRLDAVLIEGHRAGWAAALDAGFASSPNPRR